ncbi:hypothetical protein NDN08_003508 [Rhodosorus marinus]|uniref:Smr domain-containing protein n=1 Tax=Rhodosorus marinus TaxID=101924 RepID=A0AAV8UWR2_9RHOD|nr:hypothetical protein NDN08_003508 [Rhodosorus marinus]
MENTEDALLKAIEMGDSEALASLMGGVAVAKPSPDLKERKGLKLSQELDGPSTVEDRKKDDVVLESPKEEEGRVEDDPEVRGILNSEDASLFDKEAYDAAVSAWSSAFPSLVDDARVGEPGEPGEPGLDFASVTKERSLVDEFPWVDPEDVAYILKECKYSVLDAKMFISECYTKPKGWSSIDGSRVSASSASSRGSSTNVRQTTGVEAWVETGESVSELYTRYREEASDLARLRNHCFAQAAAASSAGNGAAAHQHASKGRAYNLQMKEKHALAADAIFRYRNSRGIAGGQLDLHGLHVKEAIERLGLELEGATKHTTVRILTGSGHHSRGIHGAPRLKPAVGRYLRDSGYHYEEIADSNKYVGAYRVFL